MWSLIPWKKNDSHAGGLMTAEPFDREFARVRDDFDQLLRKVWSGRLMDDHWLTSGWGVDLDETEKEYVARIEAPGFEVGDFDISISGDRLYLKAEHEESQNGKQQRTSYRGFERMLSVPEGTLPEQVEATYRNGVLELKFPKGQEAQNRKRISVKAP